VKQRCIKTQRNVLVVCDEKTFVEFVACCLVCQKLKVEHEKPYGELQSLDVSEWKWESISIYFVIDLPKIVSSHDVIWVIVDRLTKSAHFLLIDVRFSLEKLVHLYIK